MRAVILMFDSLNRRHLQPYGCEWTQTPNFQRLSRQSVTFENSYVCSLPCMPARRDLHTGRPNFLHRGWGPLEPFDESLFELLRQSDVYSHLSTDHFHYWEDGGATYHNRYNTYDLIRGQEGDAWIGQVEPPPWPDREIPLSDPKVLQDSINREVTVRPDCFPLNATVQKGIEFLRRNREADRWLLQIEAFDPHEPFFDPDQTYRDLYSEHFDNYKGKPVEWPPYREVRESPAVVEHANFEYAALVSHCDAKLGEVLDVFDELNLWQDTMLIVWTDHGFLLGEHDCWAKCWAPFYNEVAHTPFFVHDPRHPMLGGARRSALVQPAIDLAPTLLRFFDVEVPASMTGVDLEAAIVEDTSAREHAIFGIFGGHVNITDGRYVYMRAPTPTNQPLYEYTLMPTRMRRRFLPEELAEKTSLAAPFSFTKQCPVLKIAATYGMPGGEPTNQGLKTLLFDLQDDPYQEFPKEFPDVKHALTKALIKELSECDAPAEQFNRLGLDPQTGPMLRPGTV